MVRKTCILLGALLLSQPVFALHPLETEEAGTRGAGRFQLELYGEFVEEEEGDFRETAVEAVAVLSYGVVDNVDLIVELPWNRYEVEGGGAASGDEDGPGDLLLGVKWRFLDYGERGLSIALMPGVSLPTGDDGKGLGNGEVSGETALLVSKKGVLGGLHLNVGYRRNEYGAEADDRLLHNDIWHASFAGEINVTADITAVGNIGVETNPEKRAEEDPVFLIGGLIYSATEELFLDAGIRWGLTDAEADTAFLVGVTARF